jgi:hypothetical protein
MTKEENLYWIDEEIRTWESECQSKHPIKEALYAARKALEREPNTWNLDDAREDFMSDVYNTLDFLPTNDEANRIIDSFDRVTSGIKQEPRWIPVSKRLPDREEYIANNGRFIVSDGERSYSEYFDIYDKKCFGEPTMYGFRVDRVVAAWMPLPEPYKAESEGK